MYAYYMMTVTDWNRYLDVIFESILKDEAPIYEPKMNAYLEETVDFNKRGNRKLTGIE